MLFRDKVTEVILSQGNKISNLNKELFIPFETYLMNNFINKNFYCNYKSTPATF